jgi:anti-sigma B factor antagonist
MPESRFSVEMVGGVPVIAVPEEIDIANAAELRAALLHSAALGTATAVVNMAGTEFCDSAGLNVLIRAQQRAQAQGGEVRVVMGGAAVRRVFAVTAIDRVLPTFPSLEEALAPAPAGTISPVSAAD